MGEDIVLHSYQHPVDQHLLGLIEDIADCVYYSGRDSKDEDRRCTTNWSITYLRPIKREVIYRTIHDGTLILNYDGKFILYDGKKVYCNKEYVFVEDHVKRIIEGFHVYIEHKHPEYW